MSTTERDLRLNALEQLLRDIHGHVGEDIQATIEGGLGAEPREVWVPVQPADETAKEVIPLEVGYYLDDLSGEIHALEQKVDELRAYLPMLARMAFYETWSNGGSVPSAILRLEDFVRLHPEWRSKFCAPPEMARPGDEPLPAAAKALQDAYDDRDMAAS